MGTPYVVYCDESRHCATSSDTHMAIGGMWVQRSSRDELSHALRRIGEENGLRSELKWSKVSHKYLSAYLKVVDFFFDQEALTYRAIVADHRKFNPVFHNGDKELGFYKFYFLMLEKWLFDGNEYTVLLDFQKNRGADRFGDLRRVLANAVPKATIHDLTVIDSSQTPLAQLADLVTGAVAAAWCGADLARPQSAKARLITHIAQRVGWSSLRISVGSPGWMKFNIFAINLIADRTGLRDSDGRTGQVAH